MLVNADMLCMNMINLYSIGNKLIFPLCVLHLNKKLPQIKGTAIVVNPITLDFFPILNPIPASMVTPFMNQYKRKPKAPRVSGIFGRLSSGKNMLWSQELLFK